MLALDSPRWSEMRGYRPEELPPLLRKVYADPYAGRRAMEDVWFELCDRLHHQGTVYESSIYAMPHLVTAGLAARQGVVNNMLIWLCVVIERCRLGGNCDQVPRDVLQEYNEALLRLPEVGRDCANDPNVAQARRAAKKLFSRKRGAFLPKQKSAEVAGGLFSWVAEKGTQPRTGGE